MELRDKPFKGCKSISMFGLRDLYYEPKVITTPFNTTLELKPTIPEIMRKYFIRDNESVYGYYTGLQKVNLIHGTTQIPSVVEIKTNTVDNVTRYRLCGSEYVLYPAGDINSQNCDCLSILDLLESYKDLFEADVVKTVKEYVINNNITFEDIKEYLDKYSAETGRFIQDVFTR